MEDLSEEISRGRVESDPDRSGKCPGGYTAHLSASGEKSFIRASGNYTLTFDVSTCDDNPFNAKWQGRYDWDWHVTFQDGALPGGNKESGDIAFTTEKGYAAVVIGGLAANVSMTTNEMFIIFPNTGLGEIETQGAVKKGNERCIKKSI